MWRNDDPNPRARADALLERALTQNAPIDLDALIDLLEQELRSARGGHPDRLERLSILSAALQARFERTGQVADLDRAIAVDEEAVAVTPTRRPERARFLAGLGASLATRYGHTGEQADLDRAISVLEQAIGATPADDPGRLLQLGNLGTALFERYRRTGRPVNLDRAIAVLTDTVTAIPPGDPLRAMQLSNLSNALRDRYERTGDQADLDRVLSLLEEAVAATPSGRLDHAMFLSNLGNALASRFRHTGDKADLDQAVTTLEQAVAATPADHPDRAKWSANLGYTLLAGYERTGMPSLLGPAITAFREAAQVAPAAPLVRVQAAKRWGATARVAGDRAQAVEGLTLAVRLAGQVAPRGLARADQERQLAALAGLGPQAAAACLAVGLTDRAVELFEQGRGLLLAQALDTRTDLTDLARDRPGLAEQFTHLARELDQPEDGRDPGTPASWTQANRRREAAIQLEQVLGEIRRRPGFATFMLPRPVNELLAAADGGPVILVNVDWARSDALILRPAGVEVVELPGVDEDRVVRQVNAFLDAIYDAQHPGTGPAPGETAEATAAGVIGWLWDSITGPVLERLGFTGAPPDGQPWPHVYWCPAGALARLPFHAAGHHETRFDARPATVIDRVISSTIPTVRALVHTRRPHGPERGDGDRVLAVAMPTTPGHADLPGAATEAQFLAGLLPGRVDILGLPGTPPATHDTVFKALPGHTWAHFSCHGISLPRDPSASCLLLRDHQRHPLTVLDLNRTRLERAELAYLSACSTARVEVDLPDEPIHLAAACLLAGYRHVIATLWPIDDTAAVRVSRAVYRFLAAEATVPRADAAAAALHHASRRLRHLYPRQPSRWAAHIHTGP